jgi:hypothetical protein
MPRSVRAEVLSNLQRCAESETFAVVLHDVQTHSDGANQQPWEGHESNSEQSRSVPKHCDSRIGEKKKQRFAEPLDLEA